MVNILFDVVLFQTTHRIYLRRLESLSLNSAWKSSSSSRQARNLDTLFSALAPITRRLLCWRNPSLMIMTSSLASSPRKNADMQCMTSSMRRLRVASETNSVSFPGRFLYYLLDYDSYVEAGRPMKQGSGQRWFMQPLRMRFVNLLSA